MVENKGTVFNSVPLEVGPFIQLGELGEHKLIQQGPGESTGRKRIFVHFPAQKPIWLALCYVIQIIKLGQNAKYHWNKA